ncbi:TetR/AcrR family transcriptional regulator C-terminal domain-containing protein [Actinomadura rugatobispora]|uniref:TetR/AcrR family transcriptional regulator C-terminal domain-containing protein n=1 Tax=Actinomadura rugatobispora TaxID=1994 RepID=A0ABW1A1H3_9ACTN|nr:TetR/AcrR family transcriptional regulator C-terminal domain-containing protein [Actinomadura rugatobispora]
MPKHTPQPVMRIVLNRELIVHTAVGLVERQGPKALSMRAVAGELGVTAMAMYKHVPNREALVRGIAEYVMATLDLPAATAPGDWRAGARDLTLAFRRTAAEYPRSLALVLASKAEIPVGLRAVERALALCADAGLDGRTAVHAVRVLMAYTLGTQLREAGMSRLLGERPGAPDADLDAAPDDPETVAFAHMVTLPADLADPRSDADFEFGLELFLSAIEGMGRRAR